MIGFDISAQAAEFWKEYQDVNDGGIKLNLGDFHAINQQKFDVLLMCDVFEDVRDPFNFLELSRMHAHRFVFHIPLDLSASSFARGTLLIKARNKVGHIHDYKKDLALEMLRDAGYDIVDWRYTGAPLNSSNQSWMIHFASFLRRLVYAVNKNFGVRLLGGETLLVLAR